MALSSDLISQFVKTTKDTSKKTTETVVYGTVKVDGRTYVRLDGAPENVLTPVSTTTNIKDGDRVTVMIKDHTATVTGNISFPSARNEDVENVAGQVGAVSNQVTEFGTVIAHKVTVDDIQAVNGMFNTITGIVGKYEELSAVNGEFEILIAEFIEGKSLKVDEIEAVIARLDSIKAKYGEFVGIETTELEAVNAAITNLKAYTADFTYISAVRAEIKDADIENATIDLVKINKATIDSLNSRFANIDFANIGQAAFEKIFSDTGIIKDLVVDGQHVTGELVGVTLKGDIIEGGTVVADKLVIKGDNGLYYKLNFESGNFTDAEEVPVDGLHGSVIVANSVTAEKINVEDLVAFDATIGGFKIKEDAIYSGVKESVDNTTMGVYLDRDGQMSIGDSNNYFKYFKASEDGYKLNLAVDNIQINGNPHISDILNCIRIDPKQPSIVIGAGKNSMSLLLKNDCISFEKDGNQFGWWDGVNFHTGNIVVDVTERAQFGNFAMVPRSDGSLSFLKVTDNTGFYAYVGSGTMTFYGSYPVLNNTTLTINDVPGELDGTTLILGGQ